MPVGIFFSLVIFWQRIVGFWYQSCCFLWLFPSGVATANQFPPSYPVVCILFSHRDLEHQTDADQQLSQDLWTVWKKFCNFMWILAGVLHLSFQLKMLVLHLCWVFLVMLSYSDMLQIPCMLFLPSLSIAELRSSSMRPSWAMTSWRSWSPSSWSRWWTACVGASTRRDSWSFRKENLGISSTYSQVPLPAPLCFRISNIFKIRLNTSRKFLKI